ncbi:MAG: ribbon-helix-helix domain-containing protein [Oscillospiraceae bacterium]
MIKKEKVTVSLSAETLALEEQNRANLGFANRSEFIDAALREYIGRMSINHFANEIAQVYSKLERRELKEMEDRLAMLAYKIAVELGQINLMLVESFDYDYQEAYEFRRDAVAQVNLSKGFITLPMAIKNKQGE